MVMMMALVIAMFIMLLIMLLLPLLFLLLNPVIVFDCTVNAADVVEDRAVIAANSM